jgi:FkbM family methyltransferase
MIDILKFIYKHPLNKHHRIGAIIKFIKWQISSRLINGSVVYNWINNSKLIVSRGMTGATGNIYVGLMEYEDMSFLLHYLQKDDLFFDVGANVGVYTVLASKVKKAKTIAFEPLPDTFDKLLDNIQINRLDNVISKNIGLSFEPSKLYFTTNKDTMNSVALDSDMDKQEVDVDTLDNISNQYGIPKIIKIDVEGYETNVLKGAKSILENKNLEVIILELNNSGKKFGFDDDDIHNDLLNYGFTPHTYNPFNRQIIKLDSYTSHNTIYIKNNLYEKIKLIVQQSEKFICNGLKI